MGCHALLQGISPTQGSDPGIKATSLALQADYLPLNYWGNIYHMNQHSHHWTCTLLLLLLLLSRFSRVRLCVTS